ncbi:uncharacterized protein LOC114193963 [Vigna unguiculata]|uniref:uncharacterized protein LOC114193963 n=1 Tax=Vigna unguiculata TaxID=3917 RepID=UPI001016DFC1|nr:uncharacterized protein LOC114193963 [Vigna unguiculata]
MMNPDVEVSDESYIQIITVSRDYLSHNQTLPSDYLSHNQTLPSVATSQAVSQDYMEVLYRLALVGEWHEMKPIVENDPASVRVPLTSDGDTVLHLAVRSENVKMVEELVNVMAIEDMLKPNSDGWLPVHLAAIPVRYTRMKYLYSQHLLDKMAFHHIGFLFFIALEYNLFDLAMKLFKMYTRQLTMARDGNQQTALHWLARKPSEILQRELLDHNDNSGLSKVTGMQLLREIWTEVEHLELRKIISLTTDPTPILLDALESGNDDQVIRLFLRIPQTVIYSIDSKQRNLFHLLLHYRRLNIFDEYKNISVIKYLMLGLDDEGNNVLHEAAHLPPQFQLNSGLNAVIQMKTEHAWFKKVQKSAPFELRSERNKNGKTPIEIFYDEHKPLSKEIKESAKGIAESGMLVATLVATVAFAAALTVPGDKKNPWFIVFIVTNAVALFTSSASILSFLSNFTSSRFAETEFVISLHPSLTFGPAFLIASVAAMVVAFIAASFLIFDHTTSWVSFVVTPMGVFPLLVFLLFQSRFCDDLFWSRYYRPKLW